MRQKVARWTILIHMSKFEKRYISCRSSRNNFVVDDRYNLYHINYTPYNGDKVSKNWKARLILKSGSLMHEFATGRFCDYEPQFGFAAVMILIILWFQQKIRGVRFVWKGLYCLASAALVSQTAFAFKINVFSIFSFRPREIVYLFRVSELIWGVWYAQGYL